MKVAIIGRIANDIKLYDGQTVKTRGIYGVVKDIVPQENVYIIDTYQYSRHFFSVLFKTIYCIWKCDCIFISVSLKGRKVFFPLLYYLNKICKKNIYHFLIGGRLANNIQKYPRMKKYVCSFKCNYVESKYIVSDLHKIGVKNVEYMPNFKNIDILNEGELISTNFEPYKFCTFSRVEEKKGIEDAIYAIKSINARFGRKIATIDIYGAIAAPYESQFNDILRKNKEFVCYRGCVDPELSVSTVKNYFMLLFPTKYYNEGIPGTIIDAFCAGVPVIASRWHYCDEMLTDGIEGIVYEFDDRIGLEKSIEYAIDNRDKVEKMKINCIKRANYFSVEMVRPFFEKILC